MTRCYTLRHGGLVHENRRTPPEIDPATRKHGFLRFAPIRRDSGQNENGVFACSRGGKPQNSARFVYQQGVSQRGAPCRRSDGHMTNEQLAEIVRQVVRETLPDKDEILAAIQEGVRLAFDQLWPSEVSGAIADGTREALKQ